VGQTADVFSAKNAKFPIWLSLSTLEKGKRIAFPLVPNPNIPDVSNAKVTSLGRNAQGRWFVNMLITSPLIEQTSTKMLGIDVGLNTFVATSDGWRWGEGAFKKKFLALRTRILDIRRRRQKQGKEFYSNSKRLSVLEARLSGLIKSYAGRATNLLVQHHPDTTFVIESLNLQGTHGQKRFGYRIIHNCLAAKAPILEVNPAYTSQTCPHCGYVHDLNRKKSTFKCRACGKQLHADTIGAINVLGRSVDKYVDIKTSKVEVRRVLRYLYWSRRNPANMDCPENFLEPLRSNRRARPWKPTGRKTKQKTRQILRPHTSKGKKS
jgi:transposase